MRVTIKGTNIEHTNAIDSYVMKSVSSLEKFLEPNEKSKIARVDIGKTSKHHKEGKDVFYAEITFHLNNKDFRAVAKAGDLYVAIDKMKDVIIKEVKRYHAQVRVQKQKGAREMKRRIVAG